MPTIVIQFVTPVSRHEVGAKMARADFTERASDVEILNHQGSYPLEIHLCSLL